MSVTPEDASGSHTPWWSGDQAGGHAGGSSVVRLLEDARVGVLATVTPRGRPHVVPCCFAVTGSCIYSAVDAKPKSTQALRRLANLRNDPRSSLLVHHYDDDWTTLWWMRFDCSGRIVEDANERASALQLLSNKYVQYQASAPSGEVIALDIERWSVWP